MPKSALAFHAAINQQLSHSHTNYVVVTILAVAVVAGLMLLERVRTVRDSQRGEVGSVATFVPALAAA